MNEKQTSVEGENDSIAILVLSGGQDSTTLLAHLLNTRPIEDIFAVTFDYGQRHAEELDAAGRVAGFAGLTMLQHQYIDIDDGVLKGTSPLINYSAKVETYQDAAALPGGLEKTFVPMRNMTFLTIAANRAVLWAQARGKKIAFMYTGVSQEDYGGYPDCRADFIVAVNKAIAASLDDPALPHVEILTPLMHMTKKQTVVFSETLPRGRELLAWSHTCYKGEVPPCGQCHSCLLRAKGYAEAGVTDPLLERLAEVSTPLRSE